jgi:hypothetical protein
VYSGSLYIGIQFGKHYRCHLMSVKFGAYDVDAFSIFCGFFFLEIFPIHREGSEL